MEIRENIALTEINTFRVKAFTKYYTEIFNREELKEALYFANMNNIKYLILGGGSNILFINDYDGIIIHNKIPGIEIIFDTTEEVIIEVGSGVVWDDLVLFCVKNNFYGIENLSLIPGTTGAAPIQNIGAYGVEFSDVLYSLEGMFASDYRNQLFENVDCNFGYRSSIFKTKLKNKFIITRLRIKLSKIPFFNINYKSLNEAVKEYNQSELTIELISGLIREIRNKKLPDYNVLGNAGSFFKNPEIDLDSFDKIRNEHEDVVFFKIDEDKYKIPAGWLIEKCGLKGIKRGNAGTYKEQALVIVNYGKADGKEIIKFADYIIGKVALKFDIILEPEVNII